MFSERSFGKSLKLSCFGVGLELFVPDRRVEALEPAPQALPLVAG